MALLHVNLQNGAGDRTAPWDRNTFVADGTTNYPILDASGVASGLVFTNTNGVTPSDGASGTSPTTFPAGWDINVVKSLWFSARFGGLSFKISGLAAGQGFNLSPLCWAYGDTNHTDVSVNGSVVQRYLISKTIANDPLLFTGIADASGEIHVTLDSVLDYAYFGGFILETLAAPDSVTPTATDYTYGDTITLATTLAGSITATLTDSQANVLNLTKVSDTQFTIPALVGGASTVISETGVSLEVSNGTDTAIAAITVIAPTGYTLTTLTSIVFRDLIESDWIFGFDTPAVIGDQSLENAAIATHSADGTSTFTGTGVYTYYTIQASTGGVSEIVKTVAAGAADTTIPVITADGSPTTFRDVGGVAPTFIVTALDDVDGDITGSLVESGDTVDVDTAGTYIRRWNVSDAAGNAATEVIRTIIIREPIISTDYIKPIVTSIQSTIVNQTINYKA